MPKVPQFRADEPNGTPTPKRLADVPGLCEAIEQHKNDPTTWVECAPVAEEPTTFAKLRASARTAEFLQHDTPERRALLTAAGVDPGAFPPKFWARFGSELYADVDCEEAAERGLWGKLFKSGPAPEPTGEGITTGPAPEPMEEGLITRRLSEVEARDVEWLWPQRFPLGCLSLLSGDPGIGKTWATLDMLARVTTGRPFPDAPTPPPESRTWRDRGHVLWVSGEDGDEDTIKPRFLKLGGDTSRFHSLAGVRLVGKSGEPREQSLNLGRHLELLDRWLAEHPLATAVAIDPLAAFLGGTDTHRNSDVRGLLTPLNKLARERRVAVIGINHLSKGGGDKAAYRSIGSIAFVAAARSCWQVSVDNKAPKDRRLFTKVKSNLTSEDVGGLAFRVGKHVGGFMWEQGTIDTTADEALRPADDTRAPARTKAKEWLRELLKGGAVPAAEVQSKAEAEGLCWKTITSAKAEAGVQVVKTGGKGAPWVWSLSGKGN